MSELPVLDQSQRDWLEKQQNLVTEVRWHGNNVLFETSRQGALLSTGLAVAGFFADPAWLNAFHYIGFLCFVSSTLTSMLIHYLWGRRVLRETQFQESFLQAWRSGKSNAQVNECLQRDHEPEWRSGFKLGGLQALTLALGLLFVACGVIQQRVGNASHSQSRVVDAPVPAH